MTPLAARFAEHLRAGARGDVRPLAAALRAAGLALEADHLVDDGWATASGAWAGTRIYTGTLPPDEARPGELWLDRAEAATMLCVTEPGPGTAPTPSWIALRPVGRWQFLGFVAAAPRVARPVQVAPAHPAFDPRRIEPGPEAAPITGVTHGEATLYAWYFGKLLAGPKQWAGARDAVAARFGSLWQPGLREWSQARSSLDHSARVRFGADNWDDDPDDEYVARTERGDEPGLAERILLGELAHGGDTGFRTAVPGRVGLLTEVPSTAIAEAVTLDDVLARS